MNHRGAEVTEKKRKGRVAHWRYMRLFVRAIVGIALISLLLIAALYSYNLAQYKYNRRLWDGGNYGGVVFPYVISDGEGISLAPLWTNSDDLWVIAWECVQQVFCTIRYDEEYHYPEYIYPQYNELLQINESINIDRLIFCDNEPNYQICEAFLPRNQ